jgi:hypothetical protein
LFYSDSERETKPFEYDENGNLKKRVWFVLPEDHKLRKRRRKLIQKKMMLRLLADANEQLMENIMVD